MWIYRLYAVCALCVGHKFHWELAYHRDRQSTASFNSTGYRFACVQKLPVKDEVRVLPVPRSLP